MRLSVIVLAKNEEKKISRCLELLNFAEEIIVIDNGSTDNTVKLACDKKSKIVISKLQNFAGLRNLGKEKASGRWLLYVDADERVSPELASEIKKAVKEEREFAGYTVSRVNFFFGKIWPKPEKMVRLMKKNTLSKWQGKVHETPIISGKIGELKGVLNHFTHDNLKKMVEKTNEWSEIEAKSRYDNHHPKMNSWRFFRIIFTGFADSYFRQGGWRAGTMGLIESVYQAFSLFITYAKLWELQNQKANDQVKNK